MFTDLDRQFMHQALSLAKKAADEKEVPVGAVLVLNGEVIGCGYNRSITDHDPCAHAEILAMREAAKRIGNHRLLNSTLYVTLEPCAMCAGAAVQARVKKIVYAADDLRSGAIKSVFHVANHPDLNHRIDCEGGLFLEESVRLLRDFFEGRR